MATILLVAEQAHGHLKKATLNALTAAQQLAQKNGGQVQGIVSDILSVVSANQFKRAMWAGNAIVTVEVTTPVKVITVRATEFSAAQKGGSGQVHPLAVAAPPAKTKFVEYAEVKSARPELT